MKKILVPTDFSETATKARDYGAKIALATGGELVLLHAYETPLSVSGAGSMRNIDKLHREDAKKRLAKEEKQLKALFPDLNFKTINDASLPVSSVKTRCKEQEIDLVLMGTTGASGVKDKLIGSNTANMIGEIEAPLLTVPSNAGLDYPKKVVVATDFESKDLESDLQPMKKLNEFFKAEVHCLVVKNEKVKAEQMESGLQFFKNFFGDLFGGMHEIEGEDVENAILGYLDEHGADLLTVISHNKGFWQRLWEKSMSRAVVKHAKIPVLVLRETK